MLSERLLKEALTRRTTFLLALALFSCIVRNAECTSIRDSLEQKHADTLGYQHMGKEEKRSKAMGEAVRFLADMDRSYLGQVRPRCLTFLYSSPLAGFGLCIGIYKDKPWVS